MAYSRTEWSAAKIALHNADKPAAWGENHVRSLTSSTLQWRTGTATWAAGSDGTATLGPVDFLADGFTDQRSYPNASADPWTLLFDFGAAGVDFDSIAILYHNYSSIAGMVVTVDIADSTNFVTNVQTIATWTPGTSTKRLVALELDHGGGTSIFEYTTVRYMRIVQNPTAGAVPRIGEVFVGSRKQLKHNPSIPWDERARSSAWEENVTYGGRKNRVVHHRGRRRLAAALKPAEAPYIDDLWDLYKTDTQHGTQPFLWIDKPNTDPQGAALMMMDADFDYPRGGPNHRDLTLLAEEQGPHFVDLEA